MLFPFNVSQKCRIPLRENVTKYCLSCSSSLSNFPFNTTYSFITIIEDYNS